MKLKFWMAAQEEDRDCYNIIGRTKKEVIEEVRSSDRYKTLYHLEIEYKDAFELFEKATNEGGGRNVYIANVLSVRKLR